MHTLVVVSSRDSYDSWPNDYGLSFSMLENLSKGIGIANKSFFHPANILLTGWGVFYGGSLRTVHIAMTKWVRQFAPYVASKVVEATHPSFDFGETDNEYYEWEVSTILLTARRIAANRIMVVCSGPNADYVLQLTQGVDDFKVNNPWARSFNVRYICNAPEVCP